MRRTAIVTGASGALGRALVARLKAADVAVAAADASPSFEIEADLVLPGVDLADAASVEAAIEAVVAAFGAVDGLANIAGGFVWQTVVGSEAETWDRMYRTNLLTAALVSRATVPHLLKQGGAIVNVGAAAAADPATGMAPYAASKAGVMALTRSLANELRGQGVRVNAVLPTIPLADHPGYAGEPSGHARRRSRRLGPAGARRRDHRLPVVGRRHGGQRRRPHARSLLRRFSASPSGRLSAPSAFTCDG